jgi:ferrous iron transport protein B
MATITTRLLGNDREKRIAAAILQFAIPCSAQFAVVVALLTGAGFATMVIYSATIFSVFVIVGTVLHRMLPGTATLMLIDPGCNECLHSSKCRIANAAKFDAVTDPR